MDQQQVDEKIALVIERVRRRIQQENERQRENATNLLERRQAKERETLEQRHAFEKEIVADRLGRARRAREEIERLEVAIVPLAVVVQERHAELEEIEQAIADAQILETDPEVHAHNLQLRQGLLPLIASAERELAVRQERLEWSHRNPDLRVSIDVGEKLTADRRPGAVRPQEPGYFKPMPGFVGDGRGPHELNE